MTIRVIHESVRGSPQVDIVKKNISREQPKVQSQSGAVSTQPPLESGSRSGVVALAASSTPHNSGSVKTYKEAKETAKDIAERVLYEGEGLNAHRDVLTSAKEYIV
ncbi:MAG: hypothetical protein ACOX2O_06825 [Bdellovibrionota bacterium]